MIKLIGMNVDVSSICTLIVVVVQVEDHTYRVVNTSSRPYLTNGLTLEEVDPAAAQILFAEFKTGQTISKVETLTHDVVHILRVEKFSRKCFSPIT